MGAFPQPNYPSTLPSSLPTPLSYLGASPFPLPVETLGPAAQSHTFLILLASSLCMEGLPESHLKPDSAKILYLKVPVCLSTNDKRTDL